MVECPLSLETGWLSHRMQLKILPRSLRFLDPLGSLLWGLAVSQALQGSLLFSIMRSLSEVRSGR